MSSWFDREIVGTGRLPLLLFLIAFVLTFLFIRLSVRMIRAEVSWWPGNVTPGGLHMHHEFFGVILMSLAGFGLIALARFDTPIASGVLAAIFGIGCALVLDEFALILHLRDVYWAEEGRASIDAIFVAIAIGVLFLIGLRPFGFSAAVGEIEASPDAVDRIVIVGVVVFNVVMATVTLLKGKLWTGLVGMFVPILLIVGAIRVARPTSPWARWRYGGREATYAKSVRREQRYREPLMRWKVVAQEAVAGRFGVPDEPPPLVPLAPSPTSKVAAPNAIATALRWRRTRRQLRVTPIWRLPVLLVLASIIAAILCVTIDEFFELTIDSGTLATLLGVIAGAMATLTGLVFTAVTLAMQFGASQISVRVIPMLQREPVMRWSIGFFLATFVFSVIIAIDLAVGDPEGASPGVSTAIAAVLTVISAFLFIALVTKVGSVLNSAQLMRWIAADGRSAIRRQYPHTAPEGAELPAELPVEPAAGTARTVIQLREATIRGRVLLAVDVARLQRYAIAWGVRFDLLVAVGDYVPHNVGVIAATGEAHQVSAVAAHKVLRCLLFGDTHQPAVSAAAALQAISDIALKAISTAGNDPSSAVQALDHSEDLLLMLAPRVRADAMAAPDTLVVGYRRTWADYVALGTDEIRRHSTGQAQVHRRLRALFETLAQQCAPEQQQPILERLVALDEQVARDWPIELDRHLAQAPDRQGYGSERGSAID